MTETVSAIVITGRRMNTSERFTVASRGRFAGAVKIRSLARRAGLDAYLTAGSNQHLTREHDAFVGGDAFCHYHLITLALSQLHRTPMNLLPLPHLRRQPRSPASNAPLTWKGRVNLRPVPADRAMNKIRRQTPRRSCL